MAGNLVPLAVIISRSEALVIASMLQAAGIIVHVGGLHHASVEYNSIALGHYPIEVPDWQYADASALLAQSFAAADWQFSKGYQWAVIRLLLAWTAAAVSMATAVLFILGPSIWVQLLLWPLAFPLPPLNPQGRSDYHLAETVP